MIVKTFSGFDQIEGRCVPYVTHYQLLRTRWGCLTVLVYHRSEPCVPHDNQGNSLELILWAGYREYYYQTPAEALNPKRRLRVRHIRPGRFIWRLAEYVYQIDLFCRPMTKMRVERPAVSICWIRPKRREWGFWRETAWTPWQQFFKEEGCE